MHDLNTFFATGRRDRWVQRGIVLPLALVLLLVISILGVMAIGNSTQSEKTIQSLRSNAMAQQGAEIALRYCEDLTMEKIDNPATSQYSAAQKAKVSETSLTDQNDADALWTKSASWKSAADNPTATDNTTLIKLPEAVYKNGVAGGLKIAPSCVVQKLGSASYLITARGLGNDALLDGSTGKATAGAEVWLQSVITPES